LLLENRQNKTGGPFAFYCSERQQFVWSRWIDRPMLEFNPLETYKKYRSRMIGTHLRDVAGPAEPPARARMVPFGEGVVKLPASIAFLRQTDFDGCVKGEGGGNQPMRDYMVQTLGLEL